MPKTNDSVELNPLYVQDSQRQSHKFVIHVVTALYEGQILRFKTWRNSDPIAKAVAKKWPKVAPFYGNKTLPILVSQKNGYVEVKRGLTDLQARGILLASAANNSASEKSYGQADKEKHTVPVHQGYDAGTE